MWSKQPNYLFVYKLKMILLKTQLLANRILFEPLSIGVANWIPCLCKCKQCYFKCQGIPSVENTALFMLKTYIYIYIHQYTHTQAYTNIQSTFAIAICK